MDEVKYSVVVPVYNRPQELRELLQSLVAQHYKHFEVIVVEDGSTVSSRDVVDAFRDKLNISYYVKPNTGPGPSRNFGFQQAQGKYLVMFDSDCILPTSYFDAVERFLQQHPVDAWGGPDRGHASFSAAQQAMAYTMSSVLTTGGIRGGKKHLGWFQPRSFNMGISAAACKVTGGFQFARLAEDIEFSIRLRRAGFASALISDAFVYHKRRTSFSQFFKQVSNFGRGRVRVSRKFPDEEKIAHWFPLVFTLGGLAIPVLAVMHSPAGLVVALLYAFYFATIFFHALATTRSVAVAALSIPAAAIQLTGYGLGFLAEKVKTYMQKPADYNRY